MEKTGIIMNKCDCQIPITKENINYKCPRTWKMISQGATTGVFQSRKKLD